MKKNRKYVPKKQLVEPDLDSSFHAKQVLIDQSMDYSSFNQPWLQSNTQLLPKRISRPKSNYQIDYSKIRNRESFVNYRIPLKSSYKQRVDIKSILFPLGSEDYDNRLVSARSSMKVNKDMEKMISLVSIKNPQRSSICSERDLSRYTKSEPKKSPKRRMQNPVANSKIAALRQLLINRRKY